MKKLPILILFIIVIFGCEKKSPFESTVETGTLTLKFTHHWDGEPITADQFEQFLFTTAHGELVSIERLRYVLSDIEIRDQDFGYHLVDVGEEEGLSLTLNGIEKSQQVLQFRFGFSDANNLDGIYQDLNSASFNVPLQLGGGYHYMQFDGKYKDQNNQDANFNYHAIRAVDVSNADDLVLRDTSFSFDVGSFTMGSDTTIAIEMNVAEWFRNPHTWNLNELNTVLMPNFEAQLLMNANGQTVFSVGPITQNE